MLLRPTGHEENEESEKSVDLARHGNPELDVLSMPWSMEDLGAIFDHCWL
jgi:hypothetical protein